MRYLEKFFLREETLLPTDKSPWQWLKLYTQSAPKGHASSQIVAFDAQFKNYYIWYKIQGPFLRFSNFYNRNHSINFESFSIIICISTKGRMRYIFLIVHHLVIKFDWDVIIRDIPGKYFAFFGGVISNMPQLMKNKLRWISGF